MVAGTRVLPAILLVGLNLAVAAGATKAGQTITFAALPNKTFGDPEFTLTATASSGLPVKFASQTLSVCKVNIDKLTLVGAGTCTVRASQAGNTKYAAAPTVDRILAVTAIPAAVTPGGLNRTYNGRTQSATCATTPTGLRTRITYSDIGSGTDRINAGQYGVTCAITQAGYTGQANGTLTIAKATQRITFGNLVGKTVGDPPFTVVATASSNLPVNVVTLTPTICTIADKTVTLQSAGKCTLRASQAGNLNYNAAADVDRSFAVAAGSPVSGVHYVAAYDSALQGDWNVALWQDADHPVTANTDAAAPGVAGKAIEVQFGPNGFGAFGLANMKDWNNIHYMYLNEFRTIEFDIYFDPDSTGMGNLQFILEDSGYSNQPALVSYIPAWDPAHPENVLGKWNHVVIDLTKIGATIPRFTRFLFWNGSGIGSQPHFHMANVRLSWVDDLTPPVVTLNSITPSLSYDQLTLVFTTDKATTYRVDYGITDYNTTTQGNPDDWALNHTAVLAGVSRGHTYQYRITAWNHHTDPNAQPTPGTLTGTYAMPAVPATPPVVSSFTAAPLDMAAGGSSKLTWVATDYETLSIDHGVGSVAQISGSTGVFVSPGATTDYTITATNVAGSATRTVTITVHPVPVVHSFTATPSKISSGGTSTLTWNVDSFSSISIDHGVGTVTAISGAMGVNVSPADTTTYTLSAANAYGTVLQTATVTVTGALQHPVWVMGYYIGYQSSLQPPDKVDYSAMTHIMVGAALPRNDGTFDTSFYIDSVNGPAWAQNTVARAHANGIKAILMLGGAGAVGGFRATNDPAIRASFVNNLKALVDSYGFDGVDFDWEPLENQDRAPLITLLQALQAPGVMPRDHYLYTLPVGWNNFNFNDMADPFFGNVSAYFDRVSMMSYGMVWFGSGWQSWHSSPLFGETPSTPSSISNTVQALHTAGVPYEKIGIGVGFYSTPYENGSWQGGSFVHANPPSIPGYVTGPHQSTDTAGNRYSDNQASYSNVMQYFFADTAYRWDDIAKVPYLSFASPKIINIPGQVSDLEATYVTYDNEQSIAEKGSYVQKNGLGGLIIWTISQGYLGNWKTFGEVDPLMKAVKGAFLQ